MLPQLFVQSASQWASHQSALLSPGWADTHFNDDDSEDRKKCFAHGRSLLNKFAVARILGSPKLWTYQSKLKPTLSGRANHSQKFPLWVPADGIDAASSNNGGLGTPPCFVGRCQALNCACFKLMLF